MHVDCSPSPQSNLVTWWDFILTLGAIQITTKENGNIYILNI